MYGNIGTIVIVRICTEMYHMLLPSVYASLLLETHRVASNQHSTSHYSVPSTGTSYTRAALGGVHAADLFMCVRILGGLLDAP